ncbi:MAG: phosphoglucosamine mutase [Pseudomonadota bacterium]|jgi:phosphoglucosamine mutase
MSSERKYFGTDGIRGVASVAPLDPYTMVQLGKSIAHYFLGRRGRHRVLIGKDTRLSGYMIETSLAAGITSMGADVMLVGPLPTPGVAYLTRSMRADAGIVISASHNSFEDNGIKIFGADGYKLPDDVEREIERLIDSSEMRSMSAKPTEIGKAFRIDDAVGRYTVYLKGIFPRECTLEGLKVGFDCGNGAGYVVGPQTCVELGAEVVSRGVSPNGRNINAGFGSLFPGVARKLVLDQGLDVGVSLDGDGDRVILTDEKGNTVDGDMILALCAIDLKARGLLREPRVVATVMSNLGMEKLLERHGIEVVRTAVGDRYVLEEMIRQRLQLGGEQSGHTIFSDYSTSGDGILTALNVIAIMARTQRKLSELTAEFVRFPQTLINIPVSRKPALDSIDPIREVIKKTELELSTSGRVLVRYSGTENKCRVMVECEREDLCTRHAHDIAAVIQREIGAPQSAGH